MYLNHEQTEVLATEGIGLLASFLPEDAAKEVTTAIRSLRREPHASHDERLVRAGSIGGTIVIGNPSDPPGCCVEWPGRGLVCVR